MRLLRLIACWLRREHRARLVDLSKRDERGTVSVRCSRCGVTLDGPYGLGLPVRWER